MNFLTSFCRKMSSRRTSRRGVSQPQQLEQRLVMSAQPLPVLLVIADQQDFYYQEYGDTRTAIETSGVSVVVAATSLSPSTPHPNTGQGGGSGIVIPDITLANVNPENYSAIAFVGGWGSSMYQYAFPGDYVDGLYDGDTSTKAIVNDLINDFIDQDKYVSAICHGTTVLAWARVDGTSPLNGKNVSVPYIGSPAVTYNGHYYGYYELGQYEQAAFNGAVANLTSGQYGDPTTATDDVVVDGQIITAENYDSASLFGLVIAQQVIAAAGNNDDPNLPPVADDASWSIDENLNLGTIVGSATASDPNPDQVLTYQITAGNSGGAFSINHSTGEISVHNPAMLDFETTPTFQLTIEVSDNGEPSFSDTAIISISLNDLAEYPPASVYVSGKDLIVQGSQGADEIYIWSGTAVRNALVWMNGVQYPQTKLPAGGRVIVYSGDGNDRVFADRIGISATIFGEQGDDLILGGHSADIIDGGAGVDRIVGNSGNDLILGGDGDDYLYGNAGNDIVVGGNGNDHLDGDSGRDLLIGGLGTDYVRGGAGDDLLIGGTTSYDENIDALRSLAAEWTSSARPAERARRLHHGIAGGFRLATGETVFDDMTTDTIIGDAGIDLFFSALSDAAYADRNDLFASV